MRRFSLLLAILSALLAMPWATAADRGGLLIGPLSALDQVGSAVLATNLLIATLPNDAYGEIDRHIRANGPAEAAKLRQAARQRILGADDLPRAIEARSAPLPAQQQQAFPLAASMEAMTVALPFGFVSNILHMQPRDRNGRIFLYHEGHSGDVAELGRLQIERLLAAGYEVYAFSMPMVGRNTWPATVEVPGRGKINLPANAGHAHLNFLENNVVSPLRLFLDPVLAVVNELEQRRDGGSISMAGISGGGWTTVVYAALDPRIGRSYSVAGSLPFRLRPLAPTPSLGDYEQLVPYLYAAADYPDLYVLAADRPGRHHAQIYNLFDGCCFGGLGSIAHVAAVRDRIERLGGRFPFSLGCFAYAPSDFVDSDGLDSC